MDINFSKLPTPCYIVDERLLTKNMETLRSVMDATGCHILLAQKGFSMFSEYSLMNKYLSGTTASSLFEAKLGYEEFGGEVHIFSPAYRDDEIDEILSISDHIVFNSFEQWCKYKNKIEDYNNSSDILQGNSCKKISAGLRLNPEYTEQEHTIYDPCAFGSRLGITLDNFKPELLDGIEGLHFHTLCEQNSDALLNTLKIVEEKFGKYLYQMKWINFGGGHHITRPDYNIDTLIECINHIKSTYDVQVYLEPGEACALNTGYLASTVLSIVKNGVENAIMDTSAACHMPDVLEMPYRPEIIGAGLPNEYKYTYRLGGPTCLAGDIIGEYSFKEPLSTGDILVFCDMAHYSMVKNNTFNGMNLPAIASYNEKDGIKIIKEFGYLDFKNRLS